MDREACNNALIQPFPLVFQSRLRDLSMSDSISNIYHYKKTARYLPYPERTIFYKNMAKCIIINIRYLILTCRYIRIKRLRKTGQSRPWRPLPPTGPRPP